MVSFIIPLVTTFWLGILTAISPCPLATNIAAISFVGRRVDKPDKVLLSGILYTLGRTLTYVILGMILVNSMIKAPMLSHYLQKYMNLFIGPLLILVGMVLVGLLSFNINVKGISNGMEKQVEKGGILAPLLLGILFALSFCPTSAALFFGSLLPIAVREQSGVFIPAVYGIATGLPVFLFAFLIAIGANKVAIAYNRIVAIERWARYITGIIFIIIGIYFTIKYIFLV